jgi:hypothetical protein
MAENDSRQPDEDVALLYAPTDDGVGARILRARNGSIETGEIRPAKEGQPLNRGELVRLKPRAETSCVCDVEVLYRTPSPPTPGGDAAGAAPEKTGPNKANAEKAEASKSGPAQVATERYRDNWDRTFGSTGRRRSTLN